MYSALFYLQYHALKNRTVQRFKRLRQPKYLLGGVVGGLYFYFYFFRTFFGIPRGQGGFSVAAAPETLALYESLGALLLLAILFLAWMIPHERAALAFTEAEVAFLFPAPISRRGLIHFKLLRSQTAILFTTLLLTLVTRRAGGHVWIRAAGWWLILSTLNLHLLGSSFARTMLLDRGITNWQRRIGILVLVFGLAAGVVVWAWHAIPGFELAQFTDLSAVQKYLATALTSGPVPYLLYPFRFVVRPYLAVEPRAFLLALGPALGLLAAHYAWVIRSNVAFEEASVANSKRLAERMAAARSGNLRKPNRKLKVKRPPFTLRPSGPPAVAFLWKNLLSAGQGFTPRVWITLAAMCIGAGIGFGQGVGSSGPVPVLALILGTLMIWSLLLGPQFLRHDFRQDLPLADVLKTYPMRGWQLALGEVLAPAAILTGVPWILLLAAAVLFSQSREPHVEWQLSLGIGLGLAMVLPMLDLIVLLIPNAAVLLFPAWFQAAKGAVAGIEVTGQRLIFMLGQFLVFIVSLIPAVVAFLIVFFLGKLLLGVNASIPLASLAAALVLATEAGLGLMLLGWLFERFDVSAELTP